MPNIDIVQELDTIRHIKKEVVDTYRNEVFLPEKQQRDAES